jgi:hypothetical protein
MTSTTRSVVLVLAGVLLAAGIVAGLVVGFVG